MLLPCVSARSRLSVNEAFSVPCHDAEVIVCVVDISAFDSCHGCDLLVNPEASLCI